MAYVHAAAMTVSTITVPGAAAAMQNTAYHESEMTPSAFKPSSSSHVKTQRPSGASPRQCRAAVTQR